MHFCHKYFCRKCFLLLFLGCYFQLCWQFNLIGAGPLSFVKTQWNEVCIERLWKKLTFQNPPKFLQRAPVRQKISFSVDHKSKINFSPRAAADNTLIRMYLCDALGYTVALLGWPFPLCNLQAARRCLSDDCTKLHLSRGLVLDDITLHWLRGTEFRFRS